MRPLIGPQYQSAKTRLAKLRSWPVAAFDSIRIYYTADQDTIQVVRILHSKRNIRRLLGQGFSD